VVAEPADKSADASDYNAYQAAAEKEPLAVKLADSVGHLRIAANTSWTLSTGYLVLFMQAGLRSSPAA
jgi:hypothetical protein